MSDHLEPNLIKRRIVEQGFQRYNSPLPLIFLNHTAAFDSVTRHKLWKILEIDGLPVKFIELIQAYYLKSTSRIRIYGEETEEFLVENWVLENAIMQHNSAETRKNLALTDLDYADYVGLLSDLDHAQKMRDDIVKWSSLTGLKRRENQMYGHESSDPNIFQPEFNSARKG
ncbi:hypothetical protein QYM36_000445 [Artemia franciscana]|uniref:Uncharacterized protein n=1 Tax=Artemia franciscana TaxID=6661 RepID=A0AA88LL13_ARTSF|nr:hypothetical protein QYM36_000445 [Artemia franciscana]